MAALGLGIGGLFLLLGGNVGSGAEKLPGIALTLSAAVLFALGAVTFDRPLQLPPVVLTAWLVGLGSAAMVLVGSILEAPELGALTVAGAGAIAYLAVVPMALCYLAWFGAIRRIPPATAASGMLLVPVVGALSASLLLGEPLGLRHVLAFALTLGGVALELRGGSATR